MNPSLSFLVVAAGAAILLTTPGCGTPRTGPLPSSQPPLPDRFPGADGSPNSRVIGWGEFFQDPVLTGLISTALDNNQELHVLQQEVAIARAGVGARKGALLPFVRLGGRAGAEKVSRNTRDGAVEEGLEIREGRKFPEPLQNYGVFADFDWEIDIWRKLRNERDAAVSRYLASKEGRNFMVTHLVAEVAESYYELLALDNQFSIFERMLEVQGRALESVHLKKASARVTELAVRRFEAEVLKNQARLFEVRQRITETENRLNFLAGRFPQPIERHPDGFELGTLNQLQSGVPAELLKNRPDVRQAELELMAAGLEVKAAGARFYPAANVSAVLGLESFTLGSPILAKENLVYGATANLLGPLINRSAIKAAFQSAHADQVAAIYRYQQKVLKAYVEVVNQLSQINNMGQSYALKSRQVEALSDSAALSSQLFDSARADYTEVLLTQREALEARIDLVEIRQSQMTALVKAYKAIGGGVTQTHRVSMPVPKTPALPATE